MIRSVFSYLAVESKHEILLENKIGDRYSNK